MKTITLSDEAYERLRSWKSADTISFSKVVLKIVPKRGTAGDMEESFSALKPLSAGEAETIRAALTWANDWNSTQDPWAPAASRESHEH